MEAPNLYQHYRLDPKENCTALGIILAGRDAELANQGLGEFSPRRKELTTAYSVLSDDSRRAIYDEALRAGRVISWQQLEYLGNFDEWPQSYTGWTEPDYQTAQADYHSAKPLRQEEPSKPVQDNPFRSAPENPFKPAEESPYPNLFTPTATPQANAANPVLGRPTGVVDYAAMAQRPTAKNRAIVAILDVLIASFLSSIVAGPLLGIFIDEDALAVSLWAIFFVAYMVIPEVKWGGSLGKKLAGWEVRDVETQERLTYLQSLKRNWFRAVQIMPGLGQVFGFIGAVVSIASVNTENGLRGAHDRFAGAEVLRKK
ncbi:RDD family protein [Corynebacterium phocae]|uniref:RDD family protein n=1 Tax=Corynebacterium phocae TaxID=161895 RepID=UPI000952F620|nr:RDD family protein [Corynebacterium phocae]KAA8722221.1 hypothetical protein F4V58_09340 [Corynebacterium phocae]